MRGLSRGGLAWGFLGVLLLSGCGKRVTASPSELARYKDLAVIGRVVREPVSELADNDPAGATGWVRDAQGDEADKQLTERIRKTMTRFVVARRFEAAAQRGLPEGVFEIVNPTKVAEVLELLLVERQGAEPDYDRLEPLGVDAIMEIRVERLGLAKESRDHPPGGFVRGQARIMTLGGKTLWALPFDVDESRDRMVEVSGSDFSGNVDGHWQETVDRLATAVSERIRADLDVKRRAN
jgi:hypothetical protein